MIVMCGTESILQYLNSLMHDFVNDLNEFSMEIDTI